MNILIYIYIYIEREISALNSNTELVDGLSVNEWKNRTNVITWFKNINNRRLYKFLQFDKNDFYPFIKETLLHEAIQFAKENVLITRKDVEVTFHVQKSVLHNDGETWVKKEGGSFDVTMEAYDGAEVCELIQIYVIFNRKKARLGYIEMTVQPYSKM